MKRVSNIVMDCAFTILSWTGSILLYTYLLKTDSQGFILMVPDTAWFMILSCFVFYSVTGVYKNLWRYSNTGNLLRICMAAILSCFSEYVFLHIKNGYWLSPAIGMMAFYLLITLSGLVRLFPSIIDYVKLYLNVAKKNGNVTNVIVVGAGESASVFLSETRRRQSESKLKVVALVDDDKNKHGFVLHGVQVKGDCSHIPLLLKKYDADEVIIAIPSIGNEHLKSIINYCPLGKCKVKLLKSMDRQVDARDTSLRDLNIADLLGRSETNITVDGISGLILGQSILITGGGGSIGSELCRQMMKAKPSRLIIFDISENNAYDLQRELFISYPEALASGILVVRIGSVQDLKRLNEVFDEFHPSIVFHAAAYKHVPLMEECPTLAIENNVFGTYNVARVSLHHNVSRFVMISTDKAVKPTNVMGASKRLSELVIKSLNSYEQTEYVCVRFGNVLGSNGSVVPLFQKQIEMGGPVTLTHPDITRFFMTIPEAARLVLQAGAMANGGEIFILDMGQPMKIIDLAENMIRMAGLIPNVDIPIQITGLRSGDKLYEELLLDDENLTKTKNNKIYITAPTEITVDEGEAILKKLHNCIDRDEDIRKCILEIIPEYQPFSDTAEQS